MAKRPKSKRRLKPVEKSDLAIAQAVALDKRKLASKAIGRFAELGDQPPMRIVCAATLAAGAAGGDRKLFRTGLRMLLAHSLATMGKALIKDVVDRTRPGTAIDSGKYELERGKSSEHGMQSMPSGHSAGVVAVAGAAMEDYPDAVGPAAVGAVSIIAAQLPSRNHFLTDVAAGSAIGLAAVAISRQILPAVSADD
ncbi:MAG: phosphatase PAP2 family protein [Sphingomicrobium sp.]